MLTYDFIKNYFEEQGCILLEEKYIGAKIPMRYICECGNESKMCWNNFKHGQRCGMCKLRKISLAKCKHTIQYVQEYFLQNGCKLLEYVSHEGYIRVNDSLIYECKCGNISEIIWGSFKRGSRCKTCGIEKRSKSKRHDFNEVKEYFDSHGCKLLETEYKTCETPMKYLCECGKESKISYSNFKKGRRCGCRRSKFSKAKRHSIDFVKEFFQKNNCQLLEDIYTGAKTPMRYICKCGREAKITWDTFRKGSRCRKCAIDSLTGPNSPQWNPDLTYEERYLKRKAEENIKWRRKVCKRDNYTCQACLTRKPKKLHAHHLYSYKTHLDKRFDVNNGVSLCADCHKLFHKLYGRKDNTKEQFDDFLKARSYEQEKH